MKQYLDLLQHILDNGVQKGDRTGTGTLSVFGYQMRFNLADGFPAVTTKKLALKSVISELLWIIEGSTDERRLAEILYGTRDPSKKTVWTENLESPVWAPKATYPGDLGKVYGHQWRSWGPRFGPRIDQLTNLINGIKKDPNGRRHIITAWQPGDLDQMALPPCHCFVQFWVGNNKLSCQLYQRSADVFLGVPFNIASYALFTHMVAQVCNLEVGDFVHTFGDVHIYNNHIDQVEEQLLRTPYPLPALDLHPRNEITDYTMDDFRLIGYKHHEPISAKMAV
jgi:thymidylate synthase